MQLAGLLGFWLLVLAWFWTWWLRGSHAVTPFGMALNSLLLLWTTGLPAWFFFFLPRMQRPNPELPLPPGRVAMIVTKAPAEPWPVVRATLSAMLQQDFPRPFDVWLADEDPDDVTRRWCAEQGVKLSCRRGVAGYQNKTWPGRDRCKEGNLRYFYECMGGYRDYDFVAQFDADHVPTRSYLREVLRGFADPRVGYVAAPSICDSNASTSWSARARLYTEATLHGPLQAGYHGGFAPLCIGSHYAIRTRALREIGGLGPELAEDHTTSLLMNAHGWRGAFAIDAIAHGDGPASLADCLTQEFQWSRSLARILVGLTPQYWSRLTWRGKLEFGFAQIWYPLFALHFLAAWLLPPAALFLKTPWVNVSLPEFILRSALLTVACVLPVAWLRRQKLLRPDSAPVLSWEMVLFQLVRWPWVLWGVAQGIVGSVLDRDFSFKVTPKGATGVRPMPLAVVLPYAGLAALEAVAAAVVRDPGWARGYYYFALFDALTYTTALAAVVVLHLHENRVALAAPLRQALASITRASCAVSATGVLVVFALVLRGPEAVLAFVPSEAPPPMDPGTVVLETAAGVHPGGTVPLPRPALTIPPVPLLTVPRATATPAPPPPPLALPLPSAGVSIGVYDPTQSAADEPLALEHWYVPQDRPDLLAGALEHAKDRRTIMVTIEPYPVGELKAPVLDNIVRGEADSQLRALAEVVRAHAPQVVLIRWGHEMDLAGLYPWAANAPALYRAAFQHVVGVFRQQGATNARFVWSPAGNNGAQAYYPGSDAVDYVGLTVLEDDGWDARNGLPPQSFTELFAPRYKIVAPFGKPVIVAELGVSGTPARQAAWLRQAATSFSEFPLLRAVVYFNAKNPPSSRAPTLPTWNVAQSTLAQLVVQTRPGSAVASVATPTSALLGTPRGSTTQGALRAAVAAR